MNCLNIDLGFCFLEDSLATVKRTIESVRHHVRYIFAVDGRYEDYEGMDLSTPEIVEYLKSIPNVKYYPLVGRKEPDKRQIILSLCGKFETDWLLWLDADEWITDETDWDRLRKELEEKTFAKSTICTIHCLNKGYESRYPKMWFKPAGFELTKCHNFWRRKEDDTVWKSADNAPPIMSMFSKHDDLLKTKSNLDATEEYQGRLKKYESKYKPHYREIAVNYSRIKPKRFSMFEV